MPPTPSHAQRVRRFAVAEQHAEQQFAVIRRKQNHIHKFTFSFMNGCASADVWIARNANAILNPTDSPSDERRVAICRNTPKIKSRSYKTHFTRKF